MNPASALLAFWRRRRNEKARKSLLSAVRGTLAQDDDILSFKEREELEDIAAEAKMIPVDSSEAAERFGDLAERYNALTRKDTFFMWMRSVLDVLVVALSVAFGIRALFFQPFQIPTSSMQPTLFGIHYIDETEARPYRSAATRFFTPLGASRAELVATEEGVLAPGARAFSRPLFSALADALNPLNFYLSASAVQLGSQLHVLPGTDVAGNIYRYLDENPEGRLFRKGETVFKGLLSSGDHLFVDRYSIHFKPLQRGEVFVFNTEGLTWQGASVPGYYYIKRLVGMPGDELKIEDGVLWIRPRGDAEFHRADELAPSMKKLYSGMGGYHGHLPDGILSSGRVVRVPDDSYLALGDNTSHSLDSRYWGFVPAKNVIGRGLFVFWPISRRLGAIDRNDPLPVPTAPYDPYDSNSAQPRPMRLQ